MSKERSIESLMEEIRSDERFKDHAETLASEGFGELEPEMNDDGTNRTKVVVPYKDEGNKTARIEVLVTGDTIKEVELKRERGWSWLWIFPILAAALLLMKTLKRSEESAVGGDAQPRDYQGEAEGLLEAAGKKFAEGKGKEAYMLVSEAVRLILEARHGICHSLTDSEALKAFRGKDGTEGLRRCLNLCGMVEFAKYIPNKEDFSELMVLARGFVMAEKDRVSPERL